MIEILLMLVTLFLAKRPKRRRRMGRYIRGNVDTALALLTLAADALTVQAIPGTVTERTLISSVVLNVALKGAASTDGPWLVGVAHSDYSAAEIEEVIELDATWSEGDKIAQEVGKRLVRKLGVVSALGGSFASLYEGGPKRTKLNWILNAGQTIDVWVYNMGITMTTGAEMEFFGHANLFPT